MYVFVGEHVALVDFVKVLHRRGLLERGEYVVISVDDEIYDPESKHKILQRGASTRMPCLLFVRLESLTVRLELALPSLLAEYLDPFLRNGAASSAEDAVGFRSVLKLTPSHPRNPQYK